MSHWTPSLFSQTLPGFSHPAIRGSRHSTGRNHFPVPRSGHHPQADFHHLSPSLPDGFLKPPSSRPSTQLHRNHPTAHLDSLSSLLLQCRTLPLGFRENLQWLPSAYAHSPPWSQGVPRAGPNLPFLLDVLQLPTQKGDCSTGLECAPGLLPPRFFSCSSLLLECSLPIHPDLLKHSQV